MSILYDKLINAKNIFTRLWALLNILFKLKRQLKHFNCIKISI